MARDESTAATTRSLVQQLIASGNAAEDIIEEIKDMVKINGRETQFPNGSVITNAREDDGTSSSLTDQTDVSCYWYV